MANRIVITGRLVADPELRQTASNISVAKMRIAVPRKFSKEDKTDFFSVEAWRGTADFIGKHFQKGKLIEIDGSLQTQPWEDKAGSKHQGVFIVADQVSFVGDKPKEQFAATSGASVHNAPTVAPQGSPSAASNDFDPFANAPDNFDPFAPPTDAYSDDLPF